jgi:ubiquinone/menaquinone biosynthesis C-methylase UbiE
MTETANENFWDSLVSVYERWGEPSTARFADVLLDQLALDANSTVLDVAAGTGGMALAAARRGHRVRATDSSTGMVHRMIERLEPYPNCSAEVMDALDMSYDDGEFDAAFSLFGEFMYFEDAAATALGELVRVVRPGGVVGVVSWARPEAAPIFTILGEAIDRLGDPEVGPFVAPLSGAIQPADLEAGLRAAGCTDIRSQLVRVDCDWPAPEHFVAELGPLLQAHPQYGRAMSRDRSRFQALLVDVASRTASSADGYPLAEANVAYARPV